MKIKVKQMTKFTKPKQRHQHIINIYTKTITKQFKQLHLIIKFKSFIDDSIQF